MNSIDADPPRPALRDAPAVSLPAGIEHQLPTRIR